VAKLLLPTHRLPVPISEERYRTVVEDQTEVISRFRIDGTFTFVNDVYCKFFGKSSKELLGKQWQPVAVSEDLVMIEEKLDTLSKDNPIVIIENRIYSGSGEIRWMQFVNRGFFDKEGQLIEIQSVGRDINDRKLAEEKLAEYRNQLEEIIKERKQAE
jgi:PAS domain S-box-containing protein